MQMCNLQVCENWLCANLVKFVIHWRRAAGGATIPLDQDQDGAAGLGLARLNFSRWSREWIFDFTQDFLLRSELWNQPLINIILFYGTVVVGSLFTEREGLRHKSSSYWCYHYQHHRSPLFYRKDADTRQRISAKGEEPLQFNLVLLLTLDIFSK